jgi:hypothetical protein
MHKITQSTKNITPYGGLNFIYQAMNRMGLDKFLDAQIGFRSVFAKYSYSDVVYSLFGNALTQGSFIADLEVLKEKYSKQVFNKIPSPDTVEYVCQELKTPDIFKKTDTGVTHQLNYNAKMNETLVALAVKTNQLSAQGKEYTLDYDNVIIEHDKQDAQYTYKHSKGYQPGMAFIGRIPVHIENRNGNTPARFEQNETLQRCFDNLHKQNLKIKHFRADAASYQKEVIEFYNQRGDAENSNRYMLNDFNLHHLPFPDMSTNSVFMYLMGMCATLLEW